GLECQRRSYSREQRRAWGAARRVQCDSDYFVKSVLALCQTLLDTSDHPDRIGLVELAREARCVPLSTYLEYRDRWPWLTAALVRAGRRSNERVQRRLAKWLVRDVA